VEGALSFPLSSLRGRVEELPRDKRLYVFCQVRARARSVHSGGPKAFRCFLFLEGRRRLGAQRPPHAAPGRSRAPGGSPRPGGFARCRRRATPGSRAAWPQTAHPCIPRPCRRTKVGLRGYNATRQLLLSGRDAANISGGWRSAMQAGVAGSKL
jgi:hypothetical protein